MKSPIQIKNEIDSLNIGQTITRTVVNKSYAKNIKKEILIQKRSLKALRSETCQFQRLIISEYNEKIKSPDAGKDFLGGILDKITDSNYFTPYMRKSNKETLSLHKKTILYEYDQVKSNIDNNIIKLDKRKNQIQDYLDK